MAEQARQLILQSRLKIAQQVEPPFSDRGIAMAAPGGPSDPGRST